MNKISNETEKFLLDNEINIIRKLKHPDILSCIEVYETKNNTYIITEFCNSDLKKLINI